MPSLGKEKVPASLAPTKVIVQPRTKVSVGIPAPPRTKTIIPPAGIKRAQNIPTATASGGVANPYGSGVSAYEPNTEVYIAKHDAGSDNPLLRGWDAAYNAVEESKAEDSQKAAAAASNAYAVQPGVSANTSAGTGPAYLATNPKAGSGSVQAIINAAKTMLGKPYVWGGTTARGVDCSGLIYYAFQQAGINIPRYRAVDYGHMGKALTADQARAGDLVYWDEPGDTDHVGIYLGNGMVIQSPQTGDVTKISKVWAGAQYRRILNDQAFGKMATPTGGTVDSYKGQAAAQLFSPVSVAAPVNSKLSGSFNGN